MKLAFPDDIWKPFFQEFIKIYLLKRIIFYFKYLLGSSVVFEEQNNQEHEYMICQDLLDH